ncbi:uncharacterized protein LOC106649609 [Trichogramma pretiosum]|uniref:uncharacterized protein LOC106649609 n=1 Tax=Trichogramma pretiosum TaxID=7493 RepID=UPI0006C94A9F|nr:uncharacterized protein LOC106649609 [Trichogramma pretiosum]
MHTVAKILSLLLLVTSLRASLPDQLPSSYWQHYLPGVNLIFNEEAYNERSHVYALCPENDGSINRTCTITRTDELEWIRRVNDRNCTFDVTTYYDSLKPGQVKLLLLGADKAIVSAFIPTLSARRWQLSIVDFNTCSIHQPMGLDKFEPVKFIVYERSFYVIVKGSTKGMKCYHKPGSRNVRRCWIRFTDEGSPIGPRPWFRQLFDDENFILAPLQEDTEVLEDFLMIELFQQVNHKPVLAEALIQGWGKGRSEPVPEQRKRLLSHETEHKTIRLRRYTVLDLFSRWRWLNPYERIAYSTHAGYIGICAKKEDMVLICSQYDDDGRLQFEHTFDVDPALGYFHEMAVMNLAAEKGGGMLLVMAGCRDRMCNSKTHNAFRVARIGLDSDLLETVHTIPKRSCSRHINRASGKLYEMGPGRYCFTHACYEDFFVASYKNKNQERDRTVKLGRDCFTDSDLISRQNVDWSLKINKKDWFMRP